ncbi:hypothetical protein FXO37_06219 [Capsicum annuum]|nr:hypothetical protein FXO37_06219 [Capsicum annuum]
MGSIFFISAYFGCCIRHLGENIQTNYHNERVVTLFYRTTATYSREVFLDHFNQIADVYTKAIEHLICVSFEIWSRAFCLAELLERLILPPYIDPRTIKLRRKPYKRRRGVGKSFPPRRNKCFVYYPSVTTDHPSITTDLPSVIIDLPSIATDGLYFFSHVPLNVVVLLDGVCGIGGRGGFGGHRGGTGGVCGGCWWHWLVVFVVAVGGVGIRGVCGGCWWHWLVVFVMAIGGVDIHNVCGIGRWFCGGGCWCIDIGGGGRQGSVDGDKENKSEIKEKLESEKEDDHQHDDKGSLMGLELISTSQHDLVKTITIDSFQVEMLIDESVDLTGEYLNVEHPWIIPTEQELGMTYFITLGHIDTIEDPTRELIKKQLAGKTTIRREVRQGQPSIKAFHDQTTTTDPSASSGGVAGGVDASCRHVDATPSYDVEHGPFKKVNIYAELGAKKKRDLRWAKQGTKDYPIHTFSAENLRSMTDMRTQYVDRYVEEILCLMRGRQLAYPEAYDSANRIMDLDFYRNLKDRHYYLSNLALTLGNKGFHSLLFEFQWDEEIIKYIRGERPNSHGKSCTEEKSILGVMNMVEIHYWVFEILLEEGKIKSKLMDHFLMKVLMKQPWDFKGQNKDMDLPKNETIAASGSYALAHIECLLTGTKMAKPTIFLCDNAMANMQEV